MKNTLFYFVKPLIPRKFQLFLRRLFIYLKRKMYSHVWPIDPKASKKPDNWKGWPDGKKFALVLMHDVDTQIGHDNCLKLMELEKKLGFRSTFYFVPERYTISPSIFSALRKNGFDIGVHGLKHDGKLFRNKKHFLSCASRINQYLKTWNTRGFSSPSMHHNLDWMYALDIDYATSCFDTDPFEPQPDGVGTIFPFVVNNNEHNHNYVELPYTLSQDFTLLVLMKEKTINIWKLKLDWIAKNGGMAMLNSHPDYMNFNPDCSWNGMYPVTYYKEFLNYVSENYAGQFYHVFPNDIAIFWKKFSSTISTLCIVLSILY